MSVAGQGNLFSRSAKLLFSNLTIVVPFVAAALVNQAAQLLLRPSAHDGNLVPYACASFICMFTFTASYAWTTGMTETAWAQEKTILLDGKQAFFDGLDRLMLASIAGVALSTTASYLLSQFLKHQDSSFSVVLAAMAITPLAFLLSAIFAFFFIYIGPAVVIGRKNIAQAFIDSAKISTKNVRSSFITTIFLCVTFFVGYLLFTSEFVRLSIVGFLAFLLIFSPLACLINIIICGRYLSVRGYPAFDFGRTPKNNTTIPMAIVYAACFAVASPFINKGIVFLSQSSSASFKHEIGSLSVEKRLQNFIIETHSVKTNRSIEKNAINDAYSMIVPNSGAYAYLETWFPTHDPFEKAHRETRYIYGFKIRANAEPNTYEITWKEAAADPVSNVVRASENWEAGIRVMPNIPSGKPFITQIVWEKH
jgi:hypothetical protein